MGSPAGVGVVRLKVGCRFSFVNINVFLQVILFFPLIKFCNALQVIPQYSQRWPSTKTGSHSNMAWLLPKWRLIMTVFRQYAGHYQEKFDLNFSWPKLGSTSLLVELECKGQHYQPQIKSLQCTKRIYIIDPFIVDCWMLILCRKIMVLTVLHSQNWNCA